MLLNETILTFAEAAKSLPSFHGKRVHTSTIWRWARKGLHGVKLETRRLGSRFITSAEALDRFSKALSEIELPQRPAPPPKKTTNRQREKSIARAEATLRAGGIL